MTVRYRDTLIGITIGTAITIAYFKLSCKKSSNSKNIKEKKRGSTSISSSSPAISFPPSFRNEQLSRNALYFSDDGIKTLTKSRIIVVGVGGVGSHCAYMLARSGVGKLRLIDFDQVTLSSLNRHACATLSDVGLPKVNVLKDAIEKICRHYCEVDARVTMFTGDETKDGGDLLEGEWDMVVDAIDDTKTKAALLAKCVQKGIKVISCMGAGGKSDPTRLHIGDLRAASRDPLASKLRQFVKRIGGNEMIDSEFINIVFSSEKTVVGLADFSDEQKEAGVENFGAVKGMRVRVLPVLGTMPAIMGQACAAFAVCEIGGKPFSPVAGERIGKSVRHRLFQHLKNREKKFRQSIESLTPSTHLDPDPIISNAYIANKTTWIGPVQIDMDDVEYLIAEVWRNRCAITGDRLGTVLELVRWNTDKPSTCDNLVLIGSRAMNAFEDKGRQGVEEEKRRKIETRLTSCRVDIIT